MIMCTIFVNNKYGYQGWLCRKFITNPTVYPDNLNIIIKIIFYELN